MTEENKAGDNGEFNKQEEAGIPAPKDVVLTITLSPTGQLSVQAPGNGQVYDIPMALYMMELAKDHIKAVNKAQSQSRIMPAQLQPRPRIWDKFNRR